MAKQSDPERLKKIFQMLFEMATGNLTFRITDAGADELKNISVELNEIAEMLQQLLRESGCINPYYTYQNLIQLLFVLDQDFILIGFNATVPVALKHKTETMLNINFKTLLAPPSQEIWKTIKTEAAENDSYHSTVPLIFVTGDKRLMPTFCIVSRLLYSDSIIVSCVSTQLDEMIAVNAQHSYGKIRKQTEVTAVQNLHDYILSHLDEPLPSLKQLSKMFFTEENVLNNGFRTTHQTTIYNFYHEQRLKRAHLMIQQTTVGLKQLAFMNGFQSYLNFYKAFKKRFGYSPSVLTRPEEEPSE